jgi:hypothetical protein
MYRYLLFFYDDYYPLGGMEDCVLKTNNYDDINRTVKEKYEGTFYYFGTVAYYDVIEDKYFIADMQWHKGTDYFDVLKFYGWKEKTK